MADQLESLRQYQDSYDPLSNNKLTQNQTRFI